MVVPREEIIPKLLQEKRRFDPIRVWSAGCATGEEAFTLAIILAEALGADDFKSRVKIYATDVDEVTLNKARHATFETRQLDNIEPQLTEKYFEKANSGYAFRKDIRRSVIFGRHDLLANAPISRVDILTCRNTLMYFNPPAQARIIARLHFALTDSGHLMLGRAETILSHASTFRAVDLKHRIFSKVPAPRLTPQLFLMATSDNNEATTPILHDDVRDAALNITGLAQLIVDRAGDLILANQAARHIFGLSSRDIGRPFHDLDLSYRPVELRSLIDQVYFEHRPVAMSSIEHQEGPNDTVWLDLQINPLARRTGEIAGVSIVFTDVTGTRQLQQALERSNVELASAYEQLQSSNEEMETTNEELQSAVEELETTNEELQASNEELETLNEELQSTNEELHEMNEVTRAYTTELDGVNHLLESIFTSLGEHVIVVDPSLMVTFWNKGAEELWGLRSAEATNSVLTDLDFGLPVDQLVDAIAEVVSGRSSSQIIELDAVNRRGRKMHCRVTAAPLLSRTTSEIIGAILMTSEINEN